MKVQSDMELKKLQEYVEKADKALDTFNYSCKKCRRIGIKEKYTNEELDSFEALKMLKCMSTAKYWLLEINE